MENIKVPIYGTSVFLLLYLIAIGLELNYPLIFTMFMIGQALIVYMVYSVLKHGKDPKKEFDEGHWYDDHPVSGDHAD